MVPGAALGGLGWSFPTALGMQLADLDRLIVATMGDGSYMFANPVACHQIAEALELPILVLVADIIGVMGGWLISISSLHFNGTIYIINTLKFLQAEDVLLGLTKAAAFGFIIAVMGAYQGFNSNGGALGVGRAATNAVVASAVLILAANYIITSLWTH